VSLTCTEENYSEVRIQMQEVSWLLTLLNKILNDEVSDTTGDAQRHKSSSQKIFFLITPKLFNDDAI
jgi:hypothetical protein